jgi:hypothetical protein
MSFPETQHRDPSQNLSEPYSFQMPFRQQQQAVAGMLGPPVFTNRISEP